MTIDASSTPPPSRLLIVQPSWVGDAVMATPALRAIRALYPTSHIAYLARRYVKAMYTGMPWADRLLTYRSGRGGRGSPTMVELGLRLRRGKFDAAILLPGSFKSALLARLAGIERVIGYERDGRGFLLTDKLIAPREKGRFVPFAALKYYMGIAQYLGSTDRDATMQLFVTASEQREAAEVLRRAGLDPDLHRPGAIGGGPLVMLNPGAQYGAAKLWGSARFAEVGRMLAKTRGATLLVSGTPRERAILAEVMAGLRGVRAFDLSAAGMTLAALKEVVRRCDLMVTNDTGPRHIAAAFGVPVVTVFGPTDPRWTEINYPAERQVAIKVFCGPCQKKTCPLDHRCMTGIAPQRVADECAALLGGGGG